MSRLLENIKPDYFKAINNLKPEKAEKTIHDPYIFQTYAYL
jgi:hypothetical protein